jgi:hypothetical protein
VDSPTLQVSQNNSLLIPYAGKTKGFQAQDFRLQVFFMKVGFPRAPEYTMGAISNFYEK